MSSKRIDVEQPVLVDVGQFEESGTVEDIGERNGSIFSVCVNTINTVVGAGILGLPAAISAVGYVGGIILFFIVASSSQVCLHMLSSIAVKLGGDQTSYGLAARSAVPVLTLLIDLLVIFMCFFICVLYLGTAGDFLVDVARYLNPTTFGDWYTTRTFFVTLVWLGIGTPLSIPKKIAFLRYTSSVALMFIVYTVILVIIYSTKPHSVVCASFLENHNTTTCFTENCCLAEDSEECCLGQMFAFRGNALTFFESLAVFVTSFGCSFNIFPMYNGLRNPTVRRMDTGTSLAMMICTIFYISISIAGYATYGDKISGDLLGSYPLATDTTVCRIGLAFLVAVSYPLIMQPLRNTALHSIGFISLRFSGKDITDPSSTSGKVLFYVVLFILSLAAYGGALLKLDMGTILGVVGTFSFSNLSFTFPAILYWVHFSDQGWSTFRMLCIPMFVLGILILCINITVLAGV
mmetsp:Transcript_1495/g.2202  ORF Transcript_1495/g.2202 Transcript_1495/m.2202 type:complete len:463 (+) Transcript_1495:110-1498(+)